MKIINRIQSINHSIVWIIQKNKTTIILFSYNKAIAKQVTIKGIIKTYLDKKYWNYSKKTGKHRNQFLNETKAETLKKIKSGKYKLINLN